MKAFWDRLAGSGFLTFAPDPYQGEVANTIPEVEVLENALDANFLQARSEIAEATRFLVEYAGRDGHGRVMIGFSRGAYYALDLAAVDPEHIRPVVVFQGAGDSNSGNSRADYLGQFAEKDECEPPTNIDRLEQSLRYAGRMLTSYRYSGTGHWFFEPAATDIYRGRPIWRGIEPWPS